MMPKITARRACASKSCSGTKKAGFLLRPDLNNSCNASHADFGVTARAKLRVPCLFPTIPRNSTSRATP